MYSSMVRGDAGEVGTSSAAGGGGRCGADGEGGIEEVRRRLTEEIPRLRRYARVLVRDAVYADDLVQECLIRAVSRLDSYAPGTNLRAWLFVILRNVVINDYHRGRRGPALLELSEVHADLATAAAQEQHLLLDEVRQAVGKLPEEQREIILLVPVGGLAYEEVAQILDIPIGTVRSRLSRARMALRELLARGSAGERGD
ncbi:MAG: sigma-70 family RNA polymerase sigma factor [Alphaproteobacteria bacterium]